MLRNMVGVAFGAVFRSTVPVPSHHLYEVGPGTDVSHNLDDSTGNVGTVTAFTGVAL